MPESATQGPDVYVSSNKHKPWVFWLVTTTCALILSGFLYLNGGFSFTRRVISQGLCSLSKTSCNTYISIFTKIPIRDQQGNRDPSSDRYTTIAVLLTVGDNYLWVWSPYGIIRRFRIVKDSTFGVSIVYQKTSDVAKQLGPFFQDATIQSLKISESAGLSPKYSGSLLAYSSGIDKEKFRKFTRPGNLLNIAYYKKTDGLIGAILIDF